ncbi:MAG: hypothetical protein AAFQ66_19335 [Pseudomonadota bacterium]
MVRRALAALALVAPVAACGSFPTVEDSITPAGQAAPFPMIVDLDPLLAEVSETSTTPETAATVESRARRAQSRAAGLRRPVVSQTERERLEQAVADRP